MNVSPEEKQFTFTFVIPAYNCSEYISEAVNSVINQDFGFEENIQLVIVDDGSTDDTSLILDEYEHLYPANITVVHQANSGVSAARKKGLEEASGRYVSFLDADDKWSEDACTEAERCLTENKDIAFCTARHEVFGSSSNRHALSFKYSFDQIVDLNQKPDYIQLAMNNVFFRAQAARELVFDTRLSVSEDFLAMNLLLLEYPKYGILAKPSYWYRKRDDASSAIDTSTQSLSWYFDTPEFCYKRLFSESLSKFGEVKAFLQYAVMYDLQWRIKRKTRNPLTEDQMGEYGQVIRALLGSIEDTVILCQRNMSLRERLYALSFKRGIPYRKLQEAVIARGSQLLVSIDPDGYEPIAALDTQGNLNIEFMEQVNNRVRIEGNVECILDHNRVNVVAYGPDGPVRARINRRECQKYNSFFEDGYDCRIGFTIDVPVGDNWFEVVIDGNAVNANFRAKKFCPCAFKKNGYAVVGDYAILIHSEKSPCITVQRANAKYLAKRELLYEATVWSSNSTSRKLLKYRHIGLRKKMRKNKNSIWLISDRPNMAGDNGESLFKYLMENPVKGVKPYFVINEDSIDYARMKSIGPTIGFNSEKHKRMHMKADAIISSAGDDFVFDRFGPKARLALRGAESYKFIFLQHGVIHNDLSGWLNRYNKNISLFITSAKSEYDSIVHGYPYGYDPSKVVLTGLPRHDSLITSNLKPDKKVLIAPTWRQSLAGDADVLTGKRLKNPGFTSSEYFRFYNSLLNDKKLIEAAKTLGYRIDFLVHPALEQEADEFTSDYCNIVTEYDYHDEFISSAIMVTDYSSVAFDFAMLKKPLIYAQFDYDDFYKNHNWGHGYFDHSRDGFGEVCDSENEVVETLISYMENPEIDSKYAERVDKFFGADMLQSCDRCSDVVQNILHTLGM